jgi:hypothetical protein
MRSVSSLAWLTLATFVAACTPVEKDVFGEPEMLSTPSTGNASGPRFSEGDFGSLVLSWMEAGGSGTDLKFAIYGGRDFGKAAIVVTEPRMFVNWADLPSVTHVGENHWLAHWLRYSAEMTYSYDVVVSQSFDGGEIWSDPVAAHVDGTPTEHGFVSLHRDPDGVALLWLDGRETANEPSEDVLDSSMTLRSAVITPEGKRIREQLVDDSVCDCCQTDVAISASGPIAVYRDRTADEIRDIYITRFVGGKWQAGVPLHADDWSIPACPVNGPSIVAKDDTVAVAWFSAANDLPAVRVAVSKDGAITFGEPIEIASGRVAGWVGLTFIDDNALAVSWVSKTDTGSNAINIRRVSGDGQLDPVKTIGTTRQLRVFPQLAYREEYLILVWTDEIDGERHMRIARIPVS